MEQKVTIPVQGIKGCTHIQINVDYIKGEPWMGLYSRRGYYMNVRPVQINPIQVREGIIDMISYEGGGKTYFLEPTERKSPKRLKEFVEKMRRNAQAIADAFVEKNYDAVWQYI